MRRLIEFGRGVSQVTFSFLLVFGPYGAISRCRFRSQIIWLTQLKRNQQLWVQPLMDTHILALSLAGRINSSVPVLTARGCRISSSPRRVWLGSSMKASSSRIVGSLEFSRRDWIGCSTAALRVSGEVWNSFWGRGGKEEVKCLGKGEFE